MSEQAQREDAVEAVRDPYWGEGLLSPLSFAAYITWAAIVFDSVDPAALAQGLPREWIGVAALLAFLVAFAWRALIDRRGGSGVRLVALVLLQAVSTLIASWCLRDGTLGILLIIVAAQLVAMVSLAASIAWLAFFNVLLAWVWSQALDWPQVLLSILPLLGFQAFAALTGLYAVRAERASESLRLLNGELLATRELLSESARGEERLRLSRELHDVAGHKLTALKLNLAMLARDPAIGCREDARVAGRLASELLDDIRAVVGELRLHDGIELGAALRALASAIPGVRIEINVDADTRVTAMAHAETLLRCAQEALTNSLRHGAPRLIALHCRRTSEGIELSVRDDGSTSGSLSFGNGLTGMRERLEAVGGSLTVERDAVRGVHLVASVPE